MKSVKTHYRAAMPAIEAFLSRVGRGKFLYPLYEELTTQGERAFAEQTFEKSRALYHPIAQKRIEELLQAQN